MTKPSKLVGEARAMAAEQRYDGVSNPEPLCAMIDRVADALEAAEARLIQQGACSTAVLKADALSEEERVRFAEEWLRQRDLVWKPDPDLAAELDVAKARIAELEAQIYVPGLRRCAKCGCSVVATNLHVLSGGMSANDAPAPCPNGCGPMWRVTEREAGDRLVREADTAMAAGLERAAAMADAALEDCPLAKFASDDPTHWLCGWEAACDHLRNGLRSLAAEIKSEAAKESKADA